MKELRFIILILILFSLYTECQGQLDLSTHKNYCLFNGKVYNYGATVTTDYGERYQCLCTYNNHSLADCISMKWAKIGDDPYKGGSSSPRPTPPRPRDERELYDFLNIVYDHTVFGGEPGMRGSGTRGGGGGRGYTLLPPIGYKRVKSVFIGTLELNNNTLCVGKLGFKYEMEDGSDESRFVGNSDLGSEEFELKPDEYINRVEGYHNGAYITSIEFYTSKNRYIGPYGSKIGREFYTQWKVQSDNPLTCQNNKNVEVIGLRGTHSDRIDAIGIVIKCR